MTAMLPRSESGSIPATEAAAHLRRRKLLTGLRFAAIILVSAVFATPLIWMVLAAFKTNVQIGNPDDALIFSPTMQNFRNIMGEGIFLPAMVNSAVVGLVSTVLSAIIAVPAAWAIGRFGMHRAGNWVLIARIIPAISLLVPWYYLFARLELVGGYTVLVLSHMFVSVPLITWIMIGFFANLPTELEEAGRVDGLSAFGAFRRISLPLAAPGTATACVLALVFSWNNFIFALILSDESTKTLPVALFNFISYASVDWGGLMAASTLMSVPVILAAVFGQRYLVAGLTAGATKG
ncbi:carbohydrate ABC transporter permease [Actinoalloteichus hymeniacidonis]|uniref:ABC-type sugar transport system, permease component n=1 Tax=Actinoalloteichus hymeniacidonis TaxID=340345 RepID=A0AAC9HR46_9PSEU|nr:carbohydrate ABC transporter permease [Actinoalloteichus hymeniacidonis]AOS63888.1 ABC-type sugar transport system, permease component [Actinoalloteichus hymeniacidonis]MBB5908056.1 multiple sugar transport system permease protein [Actinoalloteichus hymeniacidonis]